MRKSLLLASLAVISASVLGMSEKRGFPADGSEERQQIKRVRIADSQKEETSSSTAKPFTDREIIERLTNLEHIVQRRNQQEKNNQTVESTGSSENTNQEKLIFSLNDVSKRDSFWANMLLNKDSCINQLTLQLKQYETQIQQLSVEMQNKDQELTRLKARPEINSIKQQQMFDRVEQIKKKIEKVEKENEDLKKQVHNRQDKYKIELKKKEDYKSEVNHLYKENKQLKDILSKEQQWQNTLLKPLTTATIRNKDLRRYLLILMGHSNVRSFVKRFNKDGYYKEIVRQLTCNVNIKEHFRVLDTDRYYWSSSKVSEEREIFSQSREYGEDLLNKLKDRDVITQKQLSKIDRDNKDLIEIIQELQKDRDVRRYIHDLSETNPELTSKVDKHLTWSRSREKK